MYIFVSTAKRQLNFPPILPAIQYVHSNQSHDTLAHAPWSHKVGVQEWWIRAVCTQTQCAIHIIIRIGGSGLKLRAYRPDYCVHNQMLL